jgi:hypothetical protein
MKTIFVSIASYRDTYCSRTLESLYENAKNPQRVYVGICVQNKEANEECTLEKPELIKYNKNIQTIRLKYFEAKGPTHARYLCATLFADQDYFLQIDSHTLFEKDWDQTAIDMLNEIKENTDSSDVVISHYPPNYDDIKNDSRNINNVTVNCESFFNDEGIVSFKGAEFVDMSKHDGYIGAPHIAGGMFFCEGKCIRDVPFDPNLPNLFVGEEIIHSARVWTAGYDIYAPTKNFVYHLYTREDQPKVWTDVKTFDSSDAKNKVRSIMGFQGGSECPKHLNDNIHEYGIGKKRTLDQFFKYAGIDVTQKTVNKNFCKTTPEKEGFSVIGVQPWNWDLIAMVFIIIAAFFLFIFRKEFRRLWKLRPKWLN